MNKKGIIAVGPMLVLVNFVVLLFAAIKVLVGTALVLGAAYNKKIRTHGIKAILPRILVFLGITLAIMVAVHFIVGPAGNHVVGMLFGSLVFLIIMIFISLKDFKEDKKSAIKQVLFMTFLFTLTSQLAVILAIL